jgi:hypothetical protein
VNALLQIGEDDIKSPGIQSAAALTSPHNPNMKFSLVIKCTAGLLLQFPGMQQSTSMLFADISNMWAS